MDVVVALCLVVVEGGDTLHTVPLFELVGEVPEDRVRVEPGVALRQGNDKLPGLDALALGPEPPELLLRLFCQVAPEVKARGVVGGVEVFLPVPVADIVDAPDHIGQF